MLDHHGMHNGIHSLLSFTSRFTRRRHLRGHTHHPFFIPSSLILDERQMANLNLAVIEGLDK